MVSTPCRGASVAQLLDEERSPSAAKRPRRGDQGRTSLLSRGRRHRGGALPPARDRALLWANHPRELSNQHGVEEARRRLEADRGTGTGRENRPAIDRAVRERCTEIPGHLQARGFRADLYAYADRRK